MVGLPEYSWMQHKAEEELTHGVVTSYGNRDLG